MHLVWQLQTTPTSFMSMLSGPDHTYSEGLTGPLHLYPGGLSKERHFITLKEERGANFISRSKIQWQAVKWGDLGPGKALQTGLILPGASLSMCGPSLFLSGPVCLHAHGQYDNADGPRWAKTRKTIKPGLWTQLCELDFHCPPLPIWKRPTYMQDLLFFSTLGLLT